MAIQKPTKIIMRFRINKNWMKKLRFAGIRFFKRSEDRDKAIEAKHVAEAKSIGRDPYRGKRTDAAGDKRSDSGSPIWSWDNEGNRKVSLGCIMQDIIDHTGHTMTDMHVMQRPKERGMAFLYVTFNGDPEMDVPSKAVPHLEFIMARAYDYLHGFRNPDGSWTLNPSHALQEQPFPLKVVRLTKDFRLYSELIK